MVTPMETNTPTDTEISETVTPPTLGPVRMLTDDENESLDRTLAYAQRAQSWVSGGRTDWVGELAELRDAYDALAAARSALEAAEDERTAGISHRWDVEEDDDADEHDLVEALDEAVERAEDEVEAAEQRTREAIADADERALELGRAKLETLDVGAWADVVVRMDEVAEDSRLVDEVMSIDSWDAAASFTSRHNLRFNLDQAEDGFEEDGPTGLRRYAQVYSWRSYEYQSVEQDLGGGDHPISGLQY